MNSSDNSSNISRRELGKRVGQFAAASALAGVAIPAVHAAESSTIQIALVGCGGRGTGAAVDALRVKGVRAKLVAMADAFKDRLERSYGQLTGDGPVRRPRRRPAGPAVRRLRRLQAGDGLPQARRRRDLRHAAGVPLGPLRVRDREGAQRLHGKAPLRRRRRPAGGCSKLGEEATAKNLKVGVGLMSRHARPLQELHKRIADGADRRHHPDARLPHARPRRHVPLHAQARRT